MGCLCDSQWTLVGVDLYVAEINGRGLKSGCKRSPAHELTANVGNRSLEVTNC